jgi:hypothetical protein
MEFRSFVEIHRSGFDKIRRPIANNDLRQDLAPPRPHILSTTHLPLMSRVRALGRGGPHYCCCMRAFAAAQLVEPNLFKAHYFFCGAGFNPRRVSTCDDSYSTAMGASFVGPASWVLPAEETR